MEFIIDEKSRVYELKKGEIILGRSSSCDIVINNSYVSRQHARIFLKDQERYIEDLGSKFGTFVNNKRIEKPVRLRNNDIITLGSVQLVYKIFEQERALIEEERLISKIEELEKEVGANYKQILKKWVKNYKDLKRKLQVYEFLLRIVKRINDLEPEEFLRFLLKKLVEITRAERGVIVKVEEEIPPIKFIPIYTHGQNFSLKDPLPTSIIKEVIKSGDTLLIENAIEDRNWRVHTSIFNLRIRSVLAFPLKRLGRVIGVVYFENRSFDRMFTLEDYSLMLMVAEHLKDILENYNIADSIKKKLEFLKKHYDFSELYGVSEALYTVLDLASKVAPTDLPVLLTGESGTGKELIARAIHRNSLRKAGPFVVINCAAIPRDLFEAELFGYRKGAFSGAYKDKLGKVEMADGGTLFFDELGELPIEAQVKLLRLLQFKEIEPLGSNEVKKIDIRVIAATSRDLKKLMKEGKLREELYYRLNVFHIHLPPLRERKEDIPVLVKHFLKKYSPDTPKRISKAAMQLLLHYHFPGNIRELENIIRRAIVLSRGNSLIDICHLPSELKSFSLDYKDPKTVEEVLRANNFNIKRSAELLGISRRHLYRLMEKYNIKRKQE